MMKIGANPKTFPGSDCYLKFDNMKLELQVIADQHAAVKMSMGLVHTACQFEKDIFFPSLENYLIISTKYPFYLKK
jgi:hypothetical protein